MITNIFINRKIEKQNFLYDIQKSRSRSKVVIVHANSGIGKSSLVDEVISSVPDDFWTHKVRIKQVESEDCDDGFFVRRIVKTIDANTFKYKSKYIRFVDFVTNQSFLEVSGTVVIKKLLSYFGIDDYINQVKIRERSVESWLGYDLPYLLLAQEYIKYVLNENKTILAIENTHNIDEYSLNILYEILQSSNAYIIFEYTTEVNSNISISHLCNLFERLAEVKEYYIQRLDKQEIINSLSDDDFFISVINQSYDKSDGNLHNLKIHLNNIGNSRYCNNLRYNDVIKNTVLNLDNQLKTLLVIIESHRGCITKRCLNDMVLTHMSEFIDYTKIEDYLRLLDKLCLIEYNLTDVKIKHDSLFKELNIIDELKKYYVIVLRHMCNFYTEKNSEKINVEERINNYLFLISFYLKLNSYTEIICTLKKINKDLSSFPVNTVINYVDVIKTTYETHKQDDDFDQEIDKWTIYIYFRCGYYKRIISEFSYSNIKETQVKLCYLAALSSSDPYKTLTLIEQNKEIDTMYNIGLKLIELRAIRAIENVHGCYDTWIKYYHSGVFKGSIWEGYFLRYACLCIHDDFDFRIARIEEAYNKFINSGDLYGIITSSLTLMRDYAFIGDYKRSAEWIGNANKYVGSTVFPMFMLYNNQSVLDILTRSVSNKTLLNLYSSLEICTITDDTISIKINLLCCYLVLQDTSRGLKLYETLLPYTRDNIDEDSFGVLSVVYNCYKYALLIEDREHIASLEYLYKKYEKYYEHGNTLLSTNNCQQVPSIVMNECLPILMVNWDVDYYNALSNY